MNNFQRIIAICLLIATLSFSYYLVIYIPQSKLEVNEKAEQEKQERLYMEFKDICEKENKESQSLLIPVIKPDSEPFVIEHFRYLQTDQAIENCIQKKYQSYGLSR